MVVCAYRHIKQKLRPRPRLVSGEGKVQCEKRQKSSDRQKEEREREREVLMCESGSQIKVLQTMAGWRPGLDDK